MTHTGNLSYLNSLHRKYGIWEYNMYILKKWCDGKMTVEFIKIGRKEDE